MRKYWIARYMKPLLPGEFLKITSGASRGRKNGKAAERTEWSSAREITIMGPGLLPSVESQLVNGTETLKFVEVKNFLDMFS